MSLQKKNVVEFDAFNDNDDAFPTLFYYVLL